MSYLRLDMKKINNHTLGWLLFSTVSLSPSLSAEPLTDAEALGKQVYLTGNSASGKSINVTIGADSITLPGTSLPCIGCHGEDGKGRPEGGIVPTDITYPYLTLAYGHSHDNGRKHRAFSDTSIITAIKRGLDPDGNKLDAAMPRYALPNNDAADLIAYLKRLANDVDPGVTDTTLRIGTLLPTQGPLAEIGLAMKAVLQAYFDEVNAQGGIYHRKIQLEVAEFTGEAESTMHNVRRLFENDPVFAMISPFAGNLEQDILALSESQGIPQIGPYTLFPETSSSKSQSAFYLLPGLANEARAMVDYALDALHLKHIKPMVISPENGNLKQVVEAIEQLSLARGLGAVSKFTYMQQQYPAQTMAVQLQQHDPELIFFFGSHAEFELLLKSAEGLKTKPTIFISAALTGGASSQVFKDKILMSRPAASGNPATANAFFRLIQQYNLSSQHLSTQALAYCAATLLVEGLQRTGRELSRKKLIKNLETLYQFDSGLMPSLSFGPNRHIGSTAVEIIVVPNDAGTSAK